MKKFACLFDWDGTVVDSGRTHEFTWIELARSRNLKLIDHFFEITFGKRNVEIISDILCWTKNPDEIQSMSDQKESLYREIVAQKGLPVIDGAEKFLQSLNKAGILCGVGSSTPTANLIAAFSTLDFGKYFQAFSASEDVSRGKPQPDIFLNAAEKLGVKPENCVVFEDVRAGIQAGVAAGMKTVAVATTHSVEQWREFSKTPEERVDLIIENFNEISVEDIKKLF